MEYVSLEVPIEMVYQDEGYAHELDWGDCVSWAGRALGLIGAPAVYIDKITGNNLLTPNVTIADYRGNLPVDFISILPGGVRNASGKEVYEEASDTFFKAPNVTTEAPSSQTGRNVYQIKDGFIYIEEATGELELAYKAFKIDDRGFPMIPKVDRVIEAIRTYITAKIDHRLWRQNKLDGAVYRESKQESEWYIGSAQNALRILSVDRRDTWAKHWTRLLPVVTSHDYSYAYMGNREDLNLGSEDTY